MSSNPSEPNVPVTSTPKPASWRWSPLWIAAFVAATTVVVVATTAVCLYWVLKPATYEASMTLTVSPNQTYTLFRVDDPRDAGGSFQRAQVALVRSRLVLNTALKDPKVSNLKMFEGKKDPIEWLENQVRAGYEMGPEFLTISMSGNDPEELKIVLAAITEAYLNEVVFKEHNKRLARIDQLKSIAQTYQTKLATKKQNLKQLAELAGGKNPKKLLLQQQMLQEQISSAQKDLYALVRERRRFEIELKLLEEKEKSLATAPIADHVLREAMEKEVMVREFLSREASLKVDLEKIKKVATPETFAEKSKEVARELKAVQDALEQHRKEVRPEIIKQLREKLLVETQEQIAALRAKMTFSDELEKRLTEDIKRWEAKNQTTNVQSLDIEGLNDEIAQVEAVSKKALAEAEAMEVERHAPPRVNKLDAEPIIRKVR